MAAQASSNKLVRHIHRQNSMDASQNLRLWFPLHKSLGLPHHRPVRFPEHPPRGRKTSASRVRSGRTARRAAACHGLLLPRVRVRSGIESHIWENSCSRPGRLAGRNPPPSQRMPPRMRCGVKRRTGPGSPRFADGQLMRSVGFSPKKRHAGRTVEQTS